MRIRESCDLLFEFEEGVLHSETDTDLVRVELTSKEAINLASALLQWATQIYTKETK